MSAIGPGDWVQAIASNPAEGGAINAITMGAIYQIASVEKPSGPCFTCGAAELTMDLVGQPVDTAYGWCPCAFRPWPGPADAPLISEPVDADEPVSVPA